MASKEAPFKHLVNYDLSAPEFLKRLQCEDAQEGEPSRLSCTIVGDPVPKIQWFKEDGTEIVDSMDRYHMSYSLETGQAQLSIKSTLVSDEMSYKCVASNTHGTSKTIGVLVVKANKTSKSNSPSRSSSLGPPTSQNPRSLSPLRNIEVPPSNLLPVKEETEVSSSQSEDTVDCSKVENAPSQVRKSPLSLTRLASPRADQPADQLVFVLAYRTLMNVTS